MGGSDRLGKGSQSGSEESGNVEGWARDRSEEMVWMNLIIGLVLNGGTVRIGSGSLR